VSGSAAPGRLTAIMGPSGSGKTTLLSALAGQMPYNSSIRLQVGSAGPPLRLGWSRWAAARFNPCTAEQAAPHLRPTWLQGHVCANGVPLQQAGMRAGFVQQDDLFYPQACRRWVR
jgi:energy-coupling factor transporter ATP-binding protein EcfA2